MAPNAEDYRQRTLSDLILEKIRERQGEAGLSAIPRYVITMLQHAHKQLYVYSVGPHENGPH